MSTEEPSRFNIAANDVRSFPWQDLIQGAPIKECDEYSSIFGKAAKERRDSGDEIGDRVFSFFSVITSFFPTYDNRVSPYRSMRIEPNGTRSLNPDDLAKSDLDTLAEIVHEIADPEMRARVADILWIRRRDHKAAHLAIRAFLESALKLKTDELWPPYVERLERAGQLSAAKGFEVQRTEVVETLENAILEFESNSNAGLLCCKLMELLLYLREGDASRYATLSERLANDFATAENWRFSQFYWQIAEQWHHRLNAEVDVQRSQIGAAECNISLAEEGLKKQPPQYGFAAHWMGQGLEGLRRSRADKSRIKEVHRTFLSLQKQALAELKPVPLDPEALSGVKESREKVQRVVIDYVTGQQFEEAIRRLAKITEPTDVEALKQNERKSSEGLIWDKIFGTQCLDRDGKVADKMPAIGIEGNDPDQIAMRKKMLQSASMFRWPSEVEWKIEPARQTIIDEHPVSASDLAFLVRNNPFIRPGHEGIYLRGIQAGFFGDWLVASHLLIPQLEASLRYVLQQHGVITSTRKSDGTQEERDLNQLLWDETTKRIFGENLLFDLRGILIESFGCNMRNESAHGLMYDAQFYRSESVYLWGLVIRMCWIGFTLIPGELPEISTSAD
jgi:hypothetical protein